MFRFEKIVIGNRDSFVSEEMREFHLQLSEQINGTKILVIGAAGSIGGSFVKELVGFRPSSLHVVDISENNLVEVVRDLRSSGSTLPDDFRTFAIDFTQPEFQFLLSQENYDYVLNFSALKHVRSERDPYTLMRLLNVNVLANEQLAVQLESTPPKRLFSVSSDKAVRPGNIMGASKCLMERVLLSHADQVPFSSARFANVAFSDGSLLHSFEKRLAKRQPLAAPNDVRRYFISHQEAGQLCLFGCFLSNNREIFYPKFSHTNEMQTFAEIASLFLRGNGLEPLECESEEQAREYARKLDANSKQWPCFFTASDTAGEKPFEEFVGPDETTDESRFKNLGVVTQPAFHGREGIIQALEQINACLHRKQWTKRELVEIVKSVVPELQHVEGEKNLDQKM